MISETTNKKRGRIQKAGTGSSTGTLLLITDGSSSLNVDNKNLGEQEDDSSDNSSTDLASAAAKVRRIQQQITRKSTRRNCEKGKFTASSIFRTPENNNGLSGGLADLNIDGRVGANGQESSGVGMLSNSSYDVNEGNLNEDFIQLSQEASIVRDSLLQENSQASTYLGGRGVKNNLKTDRTTMMLLLSETQKNGLISWILISNLSTYPLTSLGISVI